MKPAKDKAAAPAAKEGVIVDRGYQPYTGGYTPVAGRWAVIARRMLRTTARQPWVIVLLILAALPTVVSAVLIYLASRMEPVQSKLAKGIFEPDQLVMLPWGTTTLAFLLALFAGAGQVADDARAGAFQLYFSRPVTRDQYLWGKLLPVVGLTAVASLVPSLLLALVRLALLPSGGELVRHLPLVGATLVSGLVVAVSLALPALAASSLSRRRGYVQGLFATAYLLPWLLGRIFVSVTGSPWPAVASLPVHFQNLGRVLYRLPPGDGAPSLPLWATLLFLGLVVGGSFALLRRRLASVEVVAS